MDGEAFLLLAYKISKLMCCLPKNVGNFFLSYFSFFAYIACWVCHHQKTFCRHRYIDYVTGRLGNTQTNIRFHLYIQAQTCINVNAKPRFARLGRPTMSHITFIIQPIRYGIENSPITSPMNRCLTVNSVDKPPIIERCGINLGDQDVVIWGQ
jgi:hypothetical protein